MLKDGSKPLLEIILDQFLEAVSRVYLSVNYKAEMVRDHFGDGSLGYSDRYIHEDQRLGMAGALCAVAGTADASGRRRR